MAQSLPHLYYYPSPLGRLVLASDGTSLVGLCFDGQPSKPRWLCNHFPATQVTAGTDFADPALRQASEWLDAYFGGAIPLLAPPIALSGTPFQQAVWRLLLSIPYGQTVTYGALAAELARTFGLDRMSAQAVGHAVACNPVMLIVPCHRVVGAGGRLAGYAGGLERKQHLLQLERAELPTQ